MAIGSNLGEKQSSVAAEQASADVHIDLPVMKKNNYDEGEECPDVPATVLAFENLRFSVKMKNGMMCLQIIHCHYNHTSTILTTSYLFIAFRLGKEHIEGTFRNCAAGRGAFCDGSIR